MNIKVDREQFGTLCVCAIRYCFGRETYMPSLVQGIVRQYLKQIDDKENCNWWQSLSVPCDNPWKVTPTWNPNNEVTCNVEG